MESLEKVGSKFVFTVPLEKEAPLIEEEDVSFRADLVESNLLEPPEDSSRSLDFELPSVSERVPDR